MKSYEKLLEIVNSEADLEEYLAGRGNEEGAYDELYHLSRIRRNVLDWYEFEPSARLLEIGAECGALTGLFCEKVAEVVAFDQDEDKCIVNRARNASEKNLTVVSSPEYIAKPDQAPDVNSENTDILKSAIKKTKNALMRKGAKYDYVTIVGEFTPEKLELAAGFLASKGQLIIITDNKYGLKNWTTDARPDIATKERIIELSQEKKLKLIATFYPIPDYIFPLEVYSDQNLPSAGAIRTAAPTFDKEKTLLFDEPKTFSEMIRDGRFDEYANSYILIFEKKGSRR
ncbi:hypothetical protein SAMN02910369_02589 [Lachnospiraceae bacterium NE2001]|nr:hypothetical protein SAMN02910369_02589 [Lachnospiraceae bacterium NE2001]